MRAIGYAALCFGAVIVLSATLGMSYRSDASPSADPATDDPTTAPATPTASETATPSDSPTASDGPTPSDTPAPSDTGTPTDDPTPPADTAPPLSLGFRAFAALPTVSYSFAPLQVTATINDDTADGGTIQLFQHDGTDFVAVDSPQSITQSGDQFSFSVSQGTWLLQTFDSGDNQLDYHQFTIQPTPTVTSVTWGATVELKGTAAGYVPGSILVFRTDGYHPGSIACENDPAIDTSTGDWTCDFAAPSDSDTSLFQVAEEDYTGGITDLSSGAGHLDAPRVVAYDFASPASVTLDGFGLSSDADQGSVTYAPTNPAGDDSTDASTTCDIDLETGPVDCTLDLGAFGGEGDGSGLYRVTTKQSDSSVPGVVGASTTFVYIPGQPQLNASTAHGGITFYGAATPGESIVVHDLSSERTACTAVVSGSGTWECASTADLDDTFSATQVDTGNACGGATYACGLPHTAGGVSADSSFLTPGTAYPAVAYHFFPGGVVMDASPTGEADTVSSEFYEWKADGFPDGEGSNPFSPNPVSCPAGESTPTGPISCTFTATEPGVWNPYTNQSASASEGSSTYVDDYFVVPATPVISAATASSGRDVALTGTGVAGDGIRVIVDGATTACASTIVTSGGTWSCTIAALAAGTHGFQAYAVDLGAGRDDRVNADDSGILYVTGGLSALSTTRSVAVAVAVGAVSLPTLALAPTSIVDWFFTITGVDLNNVHPGDTFTVTGSALPPGSTVSGELHSKAISIGSTVVQPDGTFRLPVTVPGDFPAGAHTIVMTLTPPGSSAVTSQQPLKVVSASASRSGAGDTQQPSDAPSPLGSSGGPGIDDRGPNSNILTHGLNTIADVVAHPAKIPAAIEIGLVLLIFAVLPGHLLNATLAEQYERFTRRRPKREAAPGRWARLVAFLHRTPVVSGLLLTTATALLFGFADPRFGFSLASLRLFLGLAIALAIVSYLTNAVVSRIMQGRWKVDVEVRLRPLGLILTVVGVVVSRLFDFSPGFLIGLVLGLVISEKQLAKQAWRAVLLRSSILLGLALLAWLAFSLFDAKQEGGTFGSELAIETLVAVTTEAVVGLLVELLPLKLLEGEKLYEKSKVLWGALYLLAVFIFVVAVVPWEGNWAELGSSLWTWIGIVVGFGIIATGVYLSFRIRGHEEHEAHEITDADDEGLVPVASDDER